MVAAVERFGVLTDARLRIPVGPGPEDVPVRSGRELARAVRAFAAGAPRMLLFRKPGAPLLLVGVAGSRAAVEAFPSATSVRSWTARAPEPRAAAALEVLFEGEPAVFPAAHVLSLDDAIGIVTHVARTRALPATHAWVNVRGEVLAPGA